jgi:hypothetical protein
MSACHFSHELMNMKFMELIKGMIIKQESKIEKYNH